MRRILRWGMEAIEIVWWGDIEPGTAAMEFPYRGSARSFLRTYQNDNYNMATMRAIVAEHLPGLHLHRASDDDVLDRIAWGLETGWIAIAETRARVRPKGGGGTKPEPPPPGPKPLPPKPSTNYWIAIELIGEDGKPIPNENYVIELPDGSTVQGKLDEAGTSRQDGLAKPGQCKISFPNLDGSVWAKA